MMLCLFQTANASLALAAHDYCVVALAAVGWFFISRILAQRDTACADVAFFGLALVTLGGLGRASWTLLAALWGWDIEWLGNTLFPLLSAGFICLAWAVWCGLGSDTEANLLKIWLVPIGVSVAAFGVAAWGETRYAGRGWLMIMVSVVTLANLLLVLQLIYCALKWNLPWVAACFGAYLATVFVLAQLSNQEGSLHFIKQSINLVSQILFLTAAFMLYRRSCRFAQFA